MAGNLVALCLKRSPTGEKQRDICKFLLTLSMKNFQQLSFESKIPSPLTAGLTLLTIPSISSAANKSAIGVNLNEAIAILDVLRKAAHESVIGSMNCGNILKNNEINYTA
jgi:hypothetical protein